MTTKKQRRARVAAQTAERNEQLRKEGLRAQEQDKKRRELERQMRQREATKESVRMENVLAMSKMKTKVRDISGE